MEKRTGTLYSISYAGHDLPEGWPRVLAEMFVFDRPSKIPKEIADFPHTLGSGYFLTVQHVPYPIAPLKPETLASIRKKRLERKLKKAVPMFANHYYEEAIKANPNYYKGITDEKIEAERFEVIKEEWRNYLDYISRAGKLIVYANEPEEAKLRAAKLHESVSSWQMAR